MRKIVPLYAGFLVAAAVLGLLLAPSAQAQNPSCLDASDGSPTCAVDVDDDGNVGIGTSSPQALLDVRGDVYCEGGSGDIDENGVISFVDVNLIVNHLNGSSLFGPDRYARADINCDGRVDFSDVGLVIQLFQGTGHASAVQKIESVYGAIDPDTFYIDGDLGVGTSNPTDTVHVNGSLRVDGAILQRGSVLHADYVFAPDYELESIEDHAAAMWSQKHLPAMPARQVDDQGREMVDVGAHRRGLVEELEKAHLYIAQLHERLERLEAVLVEAEADDR